MDLYICASLSVIQLFLSLFLEVKPEVQRLSRLEMLSQRKPISIRKCNNMRPRLDAGESVFERKAAPDLIRGGY
jgi:hypothetical protein